MTHRRHILIIYPVFQKFYTFLFGAKKMLLSLFEVYSQYCNLSIFGQSFLIPPPAILRLINALYPCYPCTYFLV
jgi:hypothetical protein